MGNDLPGNTGNDPPLLMTQAAFARAKNVSRKTVTLWKRRGFVKMNGDLVDVRATELYMRIYASSNARGAHRPVTPAAQATQEPTGLLPDAVFESAIHRVGYDPDQIPVEILATATAIASGAAEMAWLLLRSLPVETAQSLVSDWANSMTTGYVGGDVSGLSPVSDEWPLPTDGYPAWHLHPLFTRPVMSDFDWEDAQDRAAEWRAEQGLAPL